MIRVFISILLMGIMIPVFLNGNELEDKYRGFMNETKATPSSKQVENTNKKTKVNITNQEGIVDEFFSWIKGSPVATEEDIKSIHNMINTLESSKKALDDRIRRINFQISKKGRKQGMLRKLFNDTEEIDNLEELREKLVEKRESIEENIETLTEEIAELSE